MTLSPKHTTKTNNEFHQNRQNGNKNIRILKEPTLDLDVDGKDMLDRLSSLDGWVDKFIVDSSGFSGTWYTTEDELFCLEHDGHVHFSSLAREMQDPRS
jgi:hypothetical protein